jgi:hypothetical protein
MKHEIKDQSGKVLFSAEPSGNKLNINDSGGTRLCCIEHNGSTLQIKDAKDKVISEMPTERK